MTGSTPARLNGVEPSLSGTVLAALRRHAGLTQAQLAERLGLGRTTVQNWEKGRVAMTSLSLAELARLRRILALTGVASTHLAALSTALDADVILTELDEPTAEQHPLATIVPTRALTDLLAWPMTGTVPRQLADLDPQLVVPDGYRDAQATALRTVADRANGDVAGAMLRRQAHYLLAAHQPSADWLAHSTAEATRTQRDLREWSPDWAVERSRAIVTAQAGNLDPLHRFLDRGLATEQSQRANVNYWAYWVGELVDHWTTDEDMLNPAQPWWGDRLLRSLLGGMTISAYRDLHAHTLHTLLHMRPSLVQGHHEQILTTIDRTRQSHDLSPHTIRLLDQITYAHPRR